MTPCRTMTWFWRGYAALVLAAITCWSTPMLHAIPKPLIEPDDELVPVTVCLSPAQAVRLEIAMARLGEQHPNANTSQLIDAIFEQGLQAAERDVRQ